MSLLINCPHCQHEVNVPANEPTPCPNCQQIVIAEASPGLLQKSLNYEGGPVAYLLVLLVLVPAVLVVLWLGLPYMPEMSSLGKFIQGGPLLFVALAVYFIPSLIASARHASNAGLIFLLNIITGVTIIGWVAAFIWAAVDKTKNKATT
ncbi:superinfection immunity protein [Prosthecobacter sp.]|uniref:superinfection immunity protein n=1 Tax=Prosthecobacter sp. TaxID=1965333 RepID=UPI003782E0E6